MVFIDTCLKYGINITLKHIYFAVKLPDTGREISVVKKNDILLRQREDLLVS